MTFRLHYNCPRCLVLALPRYMMLPVLEDLEKEQTRLATRKMKFLVSIRLVGRECVQSLQCISELCAAGLSIVRCAPGFAYSTCTH